MVELQSAASDKGDKKQAVPKIAEKAALVDSGLEAVQAVNKASSDGSNVSTTDLRIVKTDSPPERGAQAPPGDAPMAAFERSAAENPDFKLTRYDNGSAQLLDGKGRLVGLLDPRDFSKFPGTAITRDETRFEYGTGNDENKVTRMVIKDTATGKMTVKEVGKDDVVSIKPLKDPARPGYEVIKERKEGAKTKDEEDGLILPKRIVQTAFLDGTLEKVSQFPPDKNGHILEEHQSFRVLSKEEPTPDGKSMLPPGTILERSGYGKSDQIDLTATPPPPDNRSLCQYEKEGGKPARQIREEYREPISYKATVDGKIQRFDGITEWYSPDDGTIRLTPKDDEKPKITLVTDGKGGLKKE